MLTAANDLVALSFPFAVQLIALFRFVWIRMALIPVLVSTLWIYITPVTLPVSIIVVLVVFIIVVHGLKN